MEYSLLTNICLLVFVFAVTHAIAMGIRLDASRRKLESLQAALTEHLDNSYLTDIEYSTKILDYINAFTVQVATLNFRNFLDTHELEKVTKATLSGLVEETASMVNDSMVKENIMFEDALFTEEFYDKYIINIVMVTIKDLLDKAVES